MSRAAARRAALLIPVVATACFGPLRAAPDDPFSGSSLCCTQGAEGVTIQYLGVGGWLFRTAGGALLTAPLFSNPDLLEVGLGRIETDPDRVDRFLPPVGDVSAILVGHAHYDHLMDVPYIARRKAPAAVVFGSRTMVNLLRGDPDLDPSRLVEVESIAGDADTPGEWVEVAGGSIRFMALRSSHAPHLLGINLYAGQLEEPGTRLPERASEWLEGTTLAYLIDFLSAEGEVIYRVHYQDAASAPPDGFPPPLDDGIPVDLVILCPAGSDGVEGYPEALLRRLRPRTVFLGHWEDFFRPRTEPLRTVPGTDLDEFAGRVEAVLPEAEWMMPEPGWTVRVRGHPR